VCVLVVAGVVVLVFLLDAVVPVGGVVAVAWMVGSQRMAWAPGVGYLVPVVPVRSWVRWRQVASMTPVAIGRPFAGREGWSG
jgi:hypothetical protein